MSNINFTYLNKKVKCGLAMSLMALSLTACANNTNEKTENSGIVSEIDNTIELYPSYAISQKKIYSSDKSLKKIEKKIGTDRIVIYVIDESDYINGVELVVKDSKGNVIDNFITDGNEYILTGIEEGKTYTIEEKNVPKNYELEENSYKFTAPYKEKYSEKYSEKEYYITNFLTIYKESKEYKLRENYGEFNVCVYERGEGEIAGVTIEVSDLEGQVIETFTSTERSHNITNLKDGQYKVKIIDGMPLGYEIEMIAGLLDENDNKIETNECIITIENGTYPSKYFAGPVFYLTNTLDKINEVPKTLTKKR